MGKTDVNGVWSAYTGSCERTVGVAAGVNVGASVSDDSRLGAKTLSASAMAVIDFALAVVLDSGMAAVRPPIRASGMMTFIMPILCRSAEQSI